MKPVVTGIIFLAGVATLATQAQSLDQNLSQLSSRAAKHYVTPLASAFAGNMNAGWYHRPPSPRKLAFHFEGGVHGMGTFFGGGSRGFRVQDRLRLSRDEARPIADRFVDSAYAGWSLAQRSRLKDSLATRLALQENDVTLFGPTITGSRSDSVKALYHGGSITLGADDPFPDSATVFVLPGGDVVAPGAARSTPVLGLLRALPVLPLYAPQFTVGTVYGTNLTVRWMPETQSIEEVGTMEFFGFGVQHNPKAWLKKPLPVDITAGYFMQWLSAADMMEASSWAVQVNVSKTYGWRVFNVSPYGGLQLEGANIDFSYDQRVQRDDGSYYTVPVDFSVQGDNFVRGTVGLTVRVLAITLNADYSLSKYPGFSAGMMIGM